MDWRHTTCAFVVALFLHVGFALETHVNDQPSPHAHTVIHRPAASLQIAGDLKDVKLKSSIDHLVRALQTPSQSGNGHKPYHHPTANDNKNANVHSSEARKLYFGSEVPAPITISSQAIKINSHSNKTKPKRARSMSIVDAAGVRTIEGVRVPDDEEDKFYTWRNARVIKGFLVPNGKPANPQKKRQVVIHTNPQAYLAAATAAQAQGATTIVDRAIPAVQEAQYYTSQSQAQVASNLNLQQQQQYHQQPQQQQQPVHQYQYQLPQTAARSQSGQTTAFAYAHPQGQQMYVLHDGNAYVQYATAQTQQPVSQHSHSQNQFGHRSSEPVTPAQQTVVSPKENEHLRFQHQIAQAQAAAQAVQQLYSAGQSHQLPLHSVQVPEPSVQQIEKSEGLAKSAAQYVLQNQPQNTFAERIVHVQPQQASQAQQSGFVIQPQTYVTGPEGQAFTIPIPVPAEQASQSSASASHRQTWKKVHGSRPRTTLAERVMEALQINPKALERVDTSTAVIPALASTGLFLGLSALAAGWYLAKGNREVGIVRRTGKPRHRRDVALPSNNYPQEVDQATFFQSIIQQSLEKTQQQYENQQAEPVFTHPQEPVYAREPEPERHHSRPNKHPRIMSKPQNRDDSDFYESHKSPQQKMHFAQEKSGALTIGSSKNFAKVFIPALILGLSVISITVLIFGWYITGANREIAFLEPAQYSNRKKRSLLGSTALSDGWLQRAITAIHKNPYDRMPAPTSKSYLPHPFMDRETSKTSDLEFKVSNTGLTGVLAGGALIAIIALGLANSFSESTSRQLKSSGRNNPNTHFPTSFPVNSQLKHLRAPRSISDDFNDLSEQSPVNNPGFLSTVLSAVEETGYTLITSLHEAGLFDPHSPCSKRLVCEILSSEDDDAIRSTEKRVASFLNVLPDSVSDPLKETFGEIVFSIHKRNCGVFTCGQRS